MRAERAAAPAVFLLTALAFARSLRNAFVWDDLNLLVSTYGFRRLDWPHLRWMLTTLHTGFYGPLAWLSWSVDYRLWGLSPVGYHLTNVLLHAGAAATFCLLAEELLRRSFEEPASPRLWLAAAAGALAFSLHPLRVESVAWAAERRDVLAGLFFTGSLLAYVRGRRALSLAVYALAALSKPSVAPLPVALLALDFYPLRRSLSKEALLEKWPYAAIAALTALAAVRGWASVDNFTPLARHGLAARLGQSLYGLGFYIEKTVWPAGLAPLYPLPAPFSPSLALRGAVLLGAAEAGLRWSGVPPRARLALWLYYVAMLLPVLGVLQGGSQLVALRFSYLPCLGWALLTAAAVYRASEVRPALALAGCAAALLCAALLTQRQLLVWRDGASLWTEELRLFPDCVTARVDFAADDAAAGRFADEEAQARAALALDPAQPMARYDLAQALEGQGKRDESAAQLRALLRERPDDGLAHELLGWILLERKDFEAAAPELRRAAELRPSSAQAQYLWGSLQAARGQADLGVPFLRAATRLDPGNEAYAQALARARGDRR